MKKRALLISLLASAGAVAGFASGAANAQLNLKQFGIGGGDSAAEASGAASPGGLSQLLQTYVGANQQVLSGQSTLASAMGLSSAAGQAQQAAGLLAGGGTPSVNQLTQVGSTQQSLSQTLTQAFASRAGGGAQTPVNKQAFSEGLSSLAKGVSQ